MRAGIVAVLILASGLGAFTFVGFARKLGWPSGAAMGAAGVWGLAFGYLLERGISRMTPGRRPSWWTLAFVCTGTTVALTVAKDAFGISVRLPLDVNVFLLLNLVMAVASLAAAFALVVRWRKPGAGAG